MGNQTNAGLWVAQERLRAIERAAYWRGWVKRKDLVAQFGVSLAQASSDLQKYQELNPGALQYQMNRKRYEGARGMRCVLVEEPSLEEAMGAFLGEKIDGGSTNEGVRSTNRGLTNEGVRSTNRGSTNEGVRSSNRGLTNEGVRSSNRGLTNEGVRSTVSVVALPKRRAKAGVERAVFLTVMQGAKLRVRYWSVNSGTAKWRWLAPHAFGHDGYRWHMRAWCFENEDFRDFVLGRMEKVAWPEPLGEALPRDVDWETWETITVRPHGSLDANQQRALEMDYRMRQGKLRLKVRRAMADYLRAHLRLPAHGFPDSPTHFELVE